MKNSINKLCNIITAFSDKSTVCFNPIMGKKFNTWNQVTEAVEILKMQT